jgi:NADH-quinone oxidoreductase subunit H
VSFGVSLLKVLGAIVALWVLYAYLLRFERRVIGRLALRGDPRWGLLWPLADAARALLKRSIPPKEAYRPLYYAAPLLTLGAILEALAVVPAGPTITLLGGRLTDGPMSLDITLLLVVALSWVTLLTVLLGAWSARSDYLWEEGCRVARAGLGYSLPALLALGGAIMLTGSLDLRAIVRAQGVAFPYLLYQPLGLLTFTLSALLGSRRLPLRLPGGGNPLLGDFHLQHAGGVLALYHLVEHLHLLLIATLVATIYLAGWWGPWRAGPHWLLLKVLAVTVALLWLRDGWLARRAEQLGRRAWRILMLLAILNTLLTAIILLWKRGI